MSAQTGTPSFVPPPPSARAIDVARNSIRKAKSEPNPIWIRELKQAARLLRTPYILMTLTGLVAWLMCAIGGIGSMVGNPASTGVTLFHTFFSVAFFVVMLVGPALAANSVASEREGRTWEAVVLTGLPPKAVAKGKFMSALTAVSMYIVMMAPVGVLPFLFGGVTATEVFVAFVFLFLFATLSVAFGLAISSKMASGRTAIALTLLLAVPITLTAYLGLGLGLSFAAHEAWPAVLAGPPVWLPTAYERAPFSLEYVTFLVIVPVAAVALPAWFFYEVTVANLTSWSDDRSTGLKRWFAVMTPILVVATVVPAASAPVSEVYVGFAIAMSVMFLFLTFAVFVFVGEPIGPSRRVLVHWDRSKAKWLTRFFGPGLMRTTVLVAVLGVASLAAMGAVGMVVAWLSPFVTSSRNVQLTGVAAFMLYAAAYFLFLVGFGAWVRARASTSGVARLMLLVAIFFSSAGPWIIAAIAGVIADHPGADALVVAAPSPFYIFVLLGALNDPNSEFVLAAGAICAFAWAMIGIGLMAAAASKSKTIIARHEGILAQAEQLFAQEDAARNQPPEPAAADPAEAVEPGDQPAAEPAPPTQRTP
ncbi:MAG: ABC transporter permease [Deltaproteobacteria bacterium]|nr:ABC transporter permease [Deltaproteobacteria bacterium]